MVRIEQSADGQTLSCSCEGVIEESETGDLTFESPVISCTCDREDDPSIEIRVGESFISYKGIAEKVWLQEDKWGRSPVEFASNDEEDKIYYRASRPYDEKEIEITTVET